MSPEFEDYILALREQGLTLNTVSDRLANEGHFSKTGEPYSTSTINKAVKRARKRLDRK